MNIEEIKQIKVKSYIENIEKLLKFLVNVSEYLGIKVSDILDLFEVNQTKDVNKLRLKEISKAYAFLPDTERDNLKYSPELRSLDWALIESYSEEIKQKHERLNNVDKIVIFFANYNPEIGIYKEWIELINLFTDVEISKLKGMKLYVLFEIFKNIITQPEEETVKGFFIITQIQKLLSNSNFMNYINNVNLIIQTKLSMI